MGMVEALPPLLGVIDFSEKKVWVIGLIVSEGSGEMSLEDSAPLFPLEWRVTRILGVTSLFCFNILGVTDLWVLITGKGFT